MNTPTRFASLAVLCSALALPACSDEVLSPAAPQLAAAVTSDPFEGSCTTEIQMTGPLTMNFQSVCNMRGIGRVTGVSSQTLTPTATGILLANTSTYTTPSGDVFHATFAGTTLPTDSPTTVAFAGTETFTAGTGRFAALAGEVALSGTADLIANTGQFRTTGVVTR